MLGPFTQHSFVLTELRASHSNFMIKSFPNLLQWYSICAYHVSFLGFSIQSSLIQFTLIGIGYILWSVEADIKNKFVQSRDCSRLKFGLADSDFKGFQYIKHQRSRLTSKGMYMLDSKGTRGLLIYCKVESWCRTSVWRSHRKVVIKIGLGFCDSHYKIT